MSKAPPAEQENEPTGDAARNDRIGKHVLRSLGTPKDLLKIRVHAVGSDRFRVNVATGKDFASGRIAHSYFLTADAEGEILGCTPRIVKLY